MSTFTLELIEFAMILFEFRLHRGYDRLLFRHLRRELGPQRFHLLLHYMILSAATILLARESIYARS